MILVNNRHEESKEIPEKEIFRLIKKDYFLKKSSENKSSKIN
ncbi:hypothetical protein HNP37_001608 [Flavobacterium nitrogenifigens]|uniref:Uncharacterized protein n=2 Tax=Flavobacterium TaxID=237 RepID=A0A7W7IVZ4_9FLAO|nr:hypothetical protein [Flavobacterium nitrogenifigens]MBB6386504.1 hypothetical protein [Flavobacterium notoginsengisoli]